MMTNYKCIQEKTVLTAILIFVILLFFLNGNAQNSDFEKQLSTIKGYESKMKMYIDIGKKTGQIDFEKVIEISEEGVELARAKNDFSSMGILKRHIGNSYYFQGNYDKAATAFYQSLESLESLTKSQELAETYNSTAKLFRKTRDLDKAAQFYEKALGIYIHLNDSAGLATIYNEYGVIYEYKKEMKAAENYYIKSLVINKALKNSEGICYALNNLSGLFSLQGQYEKAEIYLGQTLALRKILNDSLALGVTYSDIGQTHIAAKKFEEANLYFDSSMFIAGELNYAELTSASLRGKAEAFEGIQNWMQAAKYYKAHKNISDSIFNLERAAQVEEINTKYETGKKQNKILEQDLQLKQRNIYLFALACVILVLSIVAQKKYRDYKQKKEKQLQDQLVNSENEKAKAILSAEDDERYRIGSDLHDGVGQLMSAVKMNISAFEDSASLLGIKDKAQLDNVINMVDHACAEVRNVSHQMMPLTSFDNRFDLAMEALVKRIHADVMKVSLYTEGFADNEPSSTKNVLYRIIQETVNNSLKHSHAKNLDINVIRDKQGITATIEDNGVGFDTNNLEKNMGVGLSNIKSRLNFINGTMEVSSEPGKGTCIVLYINP